MGNRHHRQKASIPPDQSRTETCEFIDLDEIVQHWIWELWKRTRAKSSSHYQREDLLLTLNWKHVVFTQANPCYLDGHVTRSPHSRTLFRTSFTNRTDSEQSHLFKTDQCTESTVKFSFTQRFGKCRGSTVVIRLPENAVYLAGGIQRDQSVGFGKDTIKKYPMHWNVHSPVRVAPHARVCAELNIDEEEFSCEFSMLAEFAGHVTGTIASRQYPHTPLSYIDADIVQIFRDAMKYDRRLNEFNVTDGNCPVVRYTARGQCVLTYGVEQHLILHQEPDDSPPSISDASTDRSAYGC